MKKKKKQFKKNYYTNFTIESYGTFPKNISNGKCTIDPIQQFPKIGKFLKKIPIQILPYDPSQQFPKYFQW